MKNGYGTFLGGKNKTLAHRFAYEDQIGKIDDNLFILHSCDNRACVRPDHLRPGTAAENTADMFARKRDRYTLYPELRSRVPRGLQHGNNRFTLEMAREVIRLRSEGWGYRSLALYAGVSETSIQRLVNRQTYLSRLVSS